VLGVEVLQGDGAKYNLEPFDAIFINAGATHPQDIWLDGLKFGGGSFCRSRLMPEKAAC
jgi:protein-L-isoaspartate O-methyltransferase